MMRKNLERLFLISILIAGNLVGVAQQSGAASIFTSYGDQTLRNGEFTFRYLLVDVRSGELDSKLMGRKMPYRVILPADYDVKKNEKFPVIYLLHGLTGHYTNWTEKTKIKEYAAGHNYIIVTPEGDNGWYTDSLTKPNDRYESYLIQELIPEIDAKYRTVADRDHRMIAGLSMGGFGAAKLGLKFPDTFSLVGSFSGALFASSYRTVEDLPEGMIRTSLIGIFGPPDSPAKKANDIFAMIKEATPEKIKTLPFIYQSCGTEDFLVKNNRDFLAVLNEKMVPHEYREHPGAHDWVFWDDQVREFLDLADRRIAISGKR